MRERGNRGERRGGQVPRIAFCLGVALLAACGETTELTIQVVTDGNTATLYFREPGRPSCDCNAGLFPAPGECVANNDGIQCSCDPGPAACVTRVDALLDGEVVATSEHNPGILWYGQLTLYEVGPFDALSIHGCGGTARLDVDYQNDPTLTVTGSARQDFNTIVVDWTTSEPVEYVLTSRGSSMCIVESTGQREYTLRPGEADSIWGWDRVGLRPVRREIQPTSLGAATIWHGPRTEFTWREALLASDGANSFGSVSVGSTSTPNTITITNVGDADSAPLSVSLDGSYPSDFAIVSEDCAGVVLRPDAACTADVAFAPTRAGSLSADLIVSSGFVTASAELRGVGDDGAGPGP